MPIDRTPNTGDKSTCSEDYVEIFWTGEKWVHSERSDVAHSVVPLTCSVEGCGWRAPFHVETAEDWEDMLQLHAALTLEHDVAELLDANREEDGVESQS